MLSGKATVTFLILLLLAGSPGFGWILLVAAAVPPENVQSNVSGVVFQRIQAQLPSDLTVPTNYITQVCFGGDGLNAVRFSKFHSPSAYSEPDILDWTWPAVNWTEVNDGVEEAFYYNRFSIVGGYGCVCATNDAGFMEWLRVLTDEDKTISFDRFQSLQTWNPPENWLNVSAQYDPESSNVQTVHSLVAGNMDIHYYGLGVISNGETVTSTNRYHRIKDEGKTVYLRVTRKIVTGGFMNEYNFKVSLAKTSQSSSGGVEQDVVLTRGKFPLIKVTESTNDAIAYVLGTPPEDHYYYIVINNPRELDTDTDPCTPNGSYRSTEDPVTISLQSCDDVACSAGTKCLSGSCGGAMSLQTSSSTRRIGRSWVALLFAPFLFHSGGWLVLVSLA